MCLRIRLQVSICRIKSKYIPLALFVNEYKNARIASEETGTRFSSISSCCHGKYKSANGYVWKFKEKGSD